MESSCQLFSNLTNAALPTPSYTAEGHFQGPYLLTSPFSLSVLGVGGNDGNLLWGKTNGGNSVGRITAESDHLQTREGICLLNTLSVYF